MSRQSRHGTHVAPVFEAEYPDDRRPREAIQAARDYADGLIDRTQLAANANAAAYAAAAARAAAARANAAAANAAVGSATLAERAWQTARLLEHYAGLNPANFAHKETP